MNKKIFYILAFIFSGLQAGDWGQYWQQYFGKSQPKENLLRLYPGYPYDKLTPEGKEQEEQFRNQIILDYNFIVFPASREYDPQFKAGVQAIDLEGVPFNKAFDKTILGPKLYNQFANAFQSLSDKRKGGVEYIKQIIPFRRSTFQTQAAFGKIYYATLQDLVNKYKEQGLSDEEAFRRARREKGDEASEIANKMSLEMPTYTQQEAFTRFETAEPQYKSSWWNIFGGWWQQYKERQLRNQYQSTKQARWEQAQQEGTRSAKEYEEEQLRKHYYEPTKQARWEQAQREGAQLAQQQYLPAVTRFETAEPQWNKPWFQRPEQQRLRNEYVMGQRRRFTPARQEAISKFSGETYEQICKRYGLKK